MTISPAKRLEPIPGYTLVAPLGQGGFGEVWKAEAPGGIPKAIKFVRGSLQDTDDKIHAVQELKALARVKEVRHPFILGLERVDIIDGQLIIVMELADCDVQHRLTECQARGLPGIPRGELLRYMLEAAEALDLMNIEYQLQHLDIKPRNLFLVQNHIKVADFGLVKDLEGMTAALSAGITPVYAAPETFEGTVSRFSDQYSLAIVFQELLTGTRPFDGKSAQALLMQHVCQPPDLTPLPEADRAIVGRALAKKPEERYPTCGEFVAALRQARAGAVTAVPARTALTNPSAAILRTGVALPASKTIEIDLPSATPVKLSDKVGEKVTAPSVSSGDTHKVAPSSKEPTVPMLRAEGPTARAKRRDMSCPRCGGVMLEPGPYAWCGTCGYSADMAKQATLLAPSKASPWDSVSWRHVLVGGAGVAVTLGVVSLLFSIDSDDFLRALPLFFGMVGAAIASIVLYGWLRNRQTKKRSSRTQSGGKDNRRRRATRD